MKNQTATKTISKIVLAGLIVSMLPMSLTAKTPKNPLASWKTQRPSKKAIDSAIKNITKLTKRLKKINFIVTGLIVGTGGLGVAAGIGLGVLALILSIVFGPPVVGFMPLFIVPGTISMVVTRVAPLIITGIIIAIISGIITTNLLLPITGGLTAAQIITPLARAKTLQNIEKKYPGILTNKQIEAIEKLNKVLKGPINKGIVKGMRLKNALKEPVNLALQKHTGLSKETIQNYITRSRTVKNLQLNINAYKEQIKRRQKARDKHSKWSPSWHAKNIKIIALKANPKYTLLKVRLWNLKDTLEYIREDSRLTQKLAPAVSNYMQKADEITADLRKKIAKAIVATQKKGKK